MAESVAARRGGSSLLVWLRESRSRADRSLDGRNEVFVHVCPRLGAGASADYLDAGDGDMVSRAQPLACVSLLALFLVAPSVKAGLIINEVLANEPGGAVTIEWFELYNNALV